MNDPNVTLRPDTVLETFTLAGLSIRTTNRDAGRTIPELWQRVIASDLHHSIPGAEPLAGSGSDEVPLVAVYDAYESDHTGPYTLTVGVPVRSGAGLAPELTVKTVAKQRYAHVASVGPAGPALFAAWGWVWRELTPRRAFTADLEVYLPSRAATGPVDLYVALGARGR